LSEQSVIFIYPLTDSLEEFKEKLKESGTEVYEIEDLDEAGQLIPILDDVMVFSSDLKVTKAYLEASKDFTTRSDCFCVYSNKHPLPKHMHLSLQKLGLNKAVSENVEEFEDLYKSYEENKKQLTQEAQQNAPKSALISRQVQNNEKWNIEKLVDIDDDKGVMTVQRGMLSQSDTFSFGGKALGDISRNVRSLDKQHIEKLLVDDPTKEDSIYQRIKSGQFNLKKFDPEKIIDNNEEDDYIAIIEDEDDDDDFFDQELEKDLLLELADKEMDFNLSLQDREKLEGYTKEFKQEEFQKKTKGTITADILDKVEKKEEVIELHKKRKEVEGIDWDPVPKEHLEGTNPLAKLFQSDVNKKDLEAQYIIEKKLIPEVHNSFDLLKGFSNLVHNYIETSSKTLEFLQFSFKRAFSADISIFVDNKEFFKTAANISDVFTDEEKEIDIPTFLEGEQTRFIYPFYWNRKRIGTGYFITEKKNIKNKRDIESLFILMRNLIYEHSSN
jgi:hypothetical protein